MLKLIVPPALYCSHISESKGIVEYNAHIFRPQPIMLNFYLLCFWAVLKKVTHYAQFYTIHIHSIITWWTLQGWLMWLHSYSCVCIFPLECKPSVKLAYKSGLEIDNNDKNGLQWVPDLTSRENNSPNSNRAVNRLWFNWLINQLLSWWSIIAILSMNQ